MAKKKGMGSVKRFGPRYGRTVKNKLAKIEAQMHQKHTCPFCARQAIKRKSAGIWHCNKCESTFAAKAYKVGQRTATRTKTSQVVAEAIELEE